LIRANDVNLRSLGPPHRITVCYEDLTAADDGNQDKAALSDASDLPRDLSRCVPNAVETSPENKLLNEERRPPRKAISPRKRNRNGYIPENDKEEKGIAGANGELMESRPIKNEPTFDLEEFICLKPQRSCKLVLTKSLSAKNRNAAANLFSPRVYLLKTAMQLQTCSHQEFICLKPQCSCKLVLTKSLSAKNRNAAANLFSPQYHQRPSRHLVCMQTRYHSVSTCLYRL